MAWNSSTYARLVTSKLPGFSCRHLLALGLQAHTTLPDFLHGFWRSELMLYQVSHLPTYHCHAPTSNLWS